MEHKIQIMGFQTSIDDVVSLIKKIDNVAGDSCIIQLLNADGIAGEGHILHATLQAIMAFKRNDNIANDLGLEICVRASGQRQISKALNILGLKRGLNHICAVIMGCNNGIDNEMEYLLGKRNDEVLKPDESRIKVLYQISDEEIKTSGNINRVMIERSSILVLEK